MALTQSRAALDRPAPMSAPRPPPSTSPRRTPGRAEALLGYTRIEAPFDGIVTQRNVNTGDLTQPGADKPPLFVVARSDIVTIRVNVPEAFAAEVNPGDRAAVKLQEMKGKTVEGKVTRISWALDPKTRTLRVEIDIPNPGGKLQPGLYAYATVIAEEHPDVLTVPATAVVEREGEGLLRRRRRRQGRAPPDRSSASATARGPRSSRAWTGSEAVVKANAASLTDGQPVEVVDPANPSPSGAKP